MHVDTTLDKLDYRLPWVSGDKASEPHELSEHVFRRLDRKCLGAIPLFAQAGRAEETVELTEQVLTQRQPRVVLRQHILQLRIVALDSQYRVIDHPVSCEPELAFEAQRAAGAVSGFLGTCLGHRVENAAG